jgi:paraquat-inducible protein B
MNKVNPMWIGLFVLIGLVALIGLLVVFGGGAFGGKPNRYVLFFDQSVNGLNPGATVKFRGVPIGSVERISLRVDGQDPNSRAIPIVIALKPRQLTRDLGVGAELLTKENLSHAINNGLAARLNLESFVTGLLFIELDFIGSPETTRRHLLAGENNDYWMEIPTVASPFDELTSDVVNLISKIEDINLDEIFNNLNLLIKNAGIALESIDFALLTESVVRAVDNISSLMETGKIDEAIVEFTAAAGAFSKTITSIEALVMKIQQDGIPLGVVMEETIEKAQLLIQAWTRFAESGDALLSVNSNLRNDWEDTMKTWTDTARSMRALLEQLRENPRSILSGRSLQGFDPE